MTIREGQTIPDVTIKTVDMKDITTSEIFSGKRVVLFAVPGAFTPTCSNEHLPGFIARSSDFKAKGIDTVACVSVNDAFVMKAWGESQNTGDDVLMLADGNGDLAKALGLDFDGSGIGFGVRSQRYALVANDGVVETVAVEAPMKFEVSSAEAILEKL